MFNPKITRKPGRRFIFDPDSNPNAMQFRPILLFFFLLFSCTDQHRTVYLRTDQADGLTKRSVVAVKGFPIGQVRHIGLDEKGMFIIRLELDKEPVIPADSKFLIEKQSFLGASGIAVDLGSESKPLSDGDTILLVHPPKSSIADSLSNALQNIFESLTGSKQRDSILMELRLLNENLEDLKKGQK